MLAKNAGLQRSPLHPTEFEIPDEPSEELFEKWDVDQDGRLSPMEVNESISIYNFEISIL